MTSAIRNLCLITVFTIVTFAARPARAVFMDYTGGICATFDCSDSANGSETTKIFATANWAANSTNFVIGWDVDFDPDTLLFRYTYTVSTPIKGLSHLLIEVSASFTEGNVLEGSSAHEGPDDFGDEGNSNPGLPVTTLYSLKFEGTSPFVLITDRDPMFGSFYAKDGKDNMGTVDVFAFNTGLDPANTNDFFIPVPDTSTAIPEPGSLLLLGSGLLALGLRRRRG